MLAGVRIVINGEECLLICPTLLLLGDTPAIKSMCGMSPSSSSACYVKCPCRCCKVLMENLHGSIVDPTLQGELRSVNEISELFQHNNMKTGEPEYAWLKHSLKSLGYLKFSELLRLHGQPSPAKMAIDIMHTMYLGTLKKHFLYVMSVLTCGPGCQASNRTVWKRMSDQFKMYCKRNKIAAFYNFDSELQFRRRMTAGSMKEFVRVSPYIINNLQLVPLEPDIDRRVFQLKLRSFRFWCMHVQISNMVEQHSITEAELRILDSHIKGLLLHFAQDLPNDFVTINVHYYSHIVEQIRNLGPLRLSANFSRENLIQIIKPHYTNSNNKLRECSVYSKYKMEVLCKLESMLNGAPSNNGSVGDKYR